MYESLTGRLGHWRDNHLIVYLEQIPYYVGFVFSVMIFGQRAPYPENNIV